MIHKKLLAGIFGLTLLVSEPGCSSEEKNHLGKTTPDATEEQITDKYFNKDTIFPIAYLTASLVTASVAAYFGLKEGRKQVKK